MKNKITQEEKIMKYWKTHKYINRVIAINKLGIYNLTAVISSMRKKGVDIDSVAEKKGKNYVKYCLKDSVTTEDIMVS